MNIMNIQNKLYTIHFFSPPKDRFAASPCTASMEPSTCGLCELCATPKKGRTHGKVQTLGQERIRTHVKEKL